MPIEALRIAVDQANRLGARGMIVKNVMWIPPTSGSADFRGTFAWDTEHIGSRSGGSDPWP